MRSRVTLNCWPTSSSVWSVFMPMPKRMRSTRSSRGVSVASTRVVVSRRLAWMAASIGSTTLGSWMKSPRWLSSSSPMGVSRLIGSLAIFRTLRTFSSGMARRSASSSGRRLAADLVQHLARGAHQLVDGLDHVHRDADGARLIGDGAGDGLANPPGGIGREFVAAAIFELIDRLHQADIAFLDQVQELQAAIGVFLGDGDHEAQIGLDHFLLGDAGFALALLHRLDVAAEFGDRLAGFLRQLPGCRRAGALILSRSSVTKSCQPRPVRRPTRRAQLGSSSLPKYCLRKSARSTPWAFGQAQQPAFQRRPGGG